MTMSPIDALIGFAENPALFVRTAFLNNITGLRLILLQSPHVRSAISAIRAEPTRADAVAKRIGSLLMRELPADELHPYDVAIAVYLFVLGSSSAEALDRALCAIREAKLPNLFWGYAMYNHLIGAAPASDTQRGDIDMGAKPSGAGEARGVAVRRREGSPTAAVDASDRWITADEGASHAKA